MAKGKKIVAEICLYGNHQCGAGYLAHVGPLTRDSKLFGDGEPKAGRNMTAAVWLACMDLEAAGAKGLATVYSPGGQRCGEVNIQRPCYYGNIEWRPAPMLVISAEAIEAAAQK